MELYFKEPSPAYAEMMQKKKQTVSMSAKLDQAKAEYRRAKLYPDEPFHIEPELDSSDDELEILEQELTALKLAPPAAPGVPPVPTFLPPLLPADPETVEFAFTSTDEGALGMEMEWTHPPEVKRVGKGTPAETRGIRAGDRLVAVNGEDVRDQSREQVLPRFKNRPLTVRFRRDPELMREALPMVAPEVPPPPIPPVAIADEDAEAAE